MIEAKLKPVKMLVRLRRQQTAGMIWVEVVNLDDSRFIECSVDFSDLFTSGKKGSELITAKPRCYGARKLGINEQIILEPES